MTAETRKMARLTLLLAALSAPRGLAVELALVMLPGRGIAATADEIRAEIGYLVDKGMLAPVDQKISPEQKFWRVTAEGRDHLAEEGLA